MGQPLIYPQHLRSTSRAGGALKPWSTTSPTLQEQMVGGVLSLLVLMFLPLIAHILSLLLWFVAQRVRASVFSVWVWPSMEWIACRTSWCVHPYQKTPRGWHALYCNRSNHGGDGECSAVSDCTANGTLSKYSICEHQQCYTVLPVLLRL